MLRPLALAALALLAGCVTDPVYVDERDPGMGADVEAEPIEVLVGEAGAAVPPTLYTISPARLELAEDKRYSLTLRNAGRVSHDLVIEGLNVTIASIPGQSTSEPVEFAAAEKGTYAMYCTIGGNGPTSHRNQGMRGEVVVT